MVMFPYQYQEGTPGYIEDWGINNPDSLSAGTYNYTIFDTNGCLYNSSIAITEPNELSLSSSNISNIYSVMEMLLIL